MLESLRAASSGSTGQVDPESFIQSNLVETCGNLYRRSRLQSGELPIPAIPLADGDGALLVDVGSNWGRWAIAAARRGYRVVAVDPSLSALMAGLESARKAGVDAIFVAADARSLPIQDAVADVMFSFSVLQHFAESDARQAIREMERATREGGLVLVQMANRWGLRQALNRLRQAVKRDRDPFRVRYWSPRELADTFSEIGPTSIEAESFLSLNAQPGDLHLLPRPERIVVQASELMNRAAGRWPILSSVADSLWVRATKRCES